MMHTDPLRGPKSKIKGAKSHLANLERACLELASRGDLYTIRTETDIQGGKILYKAYANISLDESFSIIVGDILGNLNAALDQLTCATALRFDAKSTRNIYFIVGESADVSKSRRFEATVKALAEPVIRLMRRLKPYKGGNEVIYGIHVLGRHERHVNLTPIAMVGHPSLYHFTLPPQRSVSITLPLVQWQSLDDGALLYGKPVGENIQIDVQAPVTVGFGKSEVFEGEPVVAIFNQAINCVERIVSIFEKFLFREA